MAPVKRETPYDFEIDGLVEMRTRSVNNKPAIITQVKRESITIKDEDDVQIFDFAHSRTVTARWQLPTTGHQGRVPRLTTTRCLPLQHLLEPLPI